MNESTSLAHTRGSVGHLQSYYLLNICHPANSMSPTQTYSSSQKWGVHYMERRRRLLSNNSMVATSTTLDLTTGHNRNLQRCRCHHHQVIGQQSLGLNFQCTPYTKSKHVFQQLQARAPGGPNVYLSSRAPGEPLMLFTFQAETLRPLMFTYQAEPLTGPNVYISSRAPAGPLIFYLSYQAEPLTGPNVYI
jgi:hypothetical protein